MKMKSFAGLEVKIEDGEVIISQFSSYRNDTIKLPIEMWDIICERINDTVLESQGYGSCDEST